MNYISYWDGNTFQNLGSGLGEVGNEGVNSLAIHKPSGYLFVGGDFGSCGNVSECRNLAMFDGLNWNSVGSGLNDFVRSLAFNQNTLFIGMYFI